MARQYCGEPGKKDICSAGVFLAYASPWGTTLVHRALYLPVRWTERRRRCRVLADLSFQTWLQLALSLLQAVVVAGPLTRALGHL